MLFQILTAFKLQQMRCFVPEQGTFITQLRFAGHECCKNRTVIEFCLHERCYFCITCISHVAVLEFWWYQCTSAFSVISFIMFLPNIIGSHVVIYLLNVLLMHPALNVERWLYRIIMLVIKENCHCNYGLMPNIYVIIFQELVLWQKLVIVDPLVMHSTFQLGWITISHLFSSAENIKKTHVGFPLLCRALEAW